MIVEIIDPNEFHEELKGCIVLPTDTIAKVLETEAIDPETVEVDTNSSQALYLTKLAETKTLNKGFQDNIKDIDLNPPTREGKQYGVSSVLIKGGKASPLSLLGITTPVKVSLHHSGFMFVTSELGAAAENQLFISLAETFRHVAIKTAGYSFSSDALRYDEIIVDMVDSLTASKVGGYCSLSGLTEEEDMWDYVSVLDLPTIYLGLIKSINPDGFNIIQACSNSIEFIDKKPAEKETDITTTEPEADNPSIDEEEFDIDADTTTKVEATKLVKCDAIAKGKVIPEELIRVNSKARLDLLAKRNVTPTDLSSYREQVFESDFDTLELRINERVVKIFIKDSSVARYIRLMHLVIADITETVDNIITEESVEYRRLKMFELFGKDELLKYANFIDKIEVEGSDAIVDDKALLSTLIGIGRDEEVKLAIVNAIKEFINKNTISVIGINEYKCPKCNMVVDDKESPIRSVIPLNLPQLFFDISNLRWG